MRTYLLILSIYVLFLPSLFCQSEFDIDIPNGTLYGRSFGKGQPILIINGGPGMNSNGFASLALELAKDYQAILFDQRGTGRSQMEKVDQETITMNRMVDDMERIRRHFGFERWVILGHSFGGMLASYYASLYPERVKGLILSSSGGLDLQLFGSLDIRSRLNESQRDSLQYWSRRIARGDTSYQARFKRGKFLAPAYLFDTSFVDQVAHRLTQSDMSINRIVWQNMREMNFDCKPSLKEFTSPVLILHGQYDPVEIEIAETANDVFPNSRLVVLPDCAHYGWLEAPDIYFKEIHQLMKQTNSN